MFYVVRKGYNNQSSFLWFSSKVTAYLDLLFLKQSLLISENVMSCEKDNNYYLGWNATHFTFNTYTEKVKYLSDYRHMSIFSDQLDFEFTFKRLNINIAYLK